MLEDPGLSPIDTIHSPLMTLAMIKANNSNPHYVLRVPSRVYSRSDQEKELVTTTHGNLIMPPL
jgi:hypothetical protein